MIYFLVVAGMSTTISSIVRILPLSEVVSAPYHRLT